MQKGATRFSFVLVGGALAVMLIGFFALRAVTAMNVRDVQRLADIRSIQATFESLFIRSGSYASAANGCSTIGSVVANCDFSPNGKVLVNVRDPGKYAYRIATVPTALAYGVSFFLERNHAGIQKGRHVLTQAGLQ